MRPAGSAGDINRLTLSRITVGGFLDLLQERLPQPACPNIGVRYVPEEWKELGKQTCFRRDANFTCECAEVRIIIPAHFEAVPKQGFKLGADPQKLKVKRQKLKCQITQDGNTLKCECVADGRATDEPLEITSHTEVPC